MGKRGTKEPETAVVPYGSPAQPNEPIVMLPLDWWPHWKTPDGSKHEGKVEEIRVRSDLNWEAVHDYTKKMRTGYQFPAIVVYHD